MSPPRTGKTFKCVICHVLFYRTLSEIKRNRIRFCSKKCAGKNATGENNPSWKGGYHITENGYKRLTNRNYEHRMVMEKALGRKLGLDECVHHKDHDKLNNNISNLQLLTYKEHAQLHAKDKRVDPTELISLREQGLSYAKIGEITGHNPGTAWRIINRLT